jgi:hypothetical protein
LLIFEGLEMSEVLRFPEEIYFTLLNLETPTDLYF